MAKTEIYIIKLYKSDCEKQVKQAFHKLTRN
jgi:hypothetical protein